MGAVLLSATKRHLWHAVSVFTVLRSGTGTIAMSSALSSAQDSSNDSSSSRSSDEVVYAAHFDIDPIATSSSDEESVED